MALTKEQQAQENEYSFPYHHVARITESGFKQLFFWGWAAEYMGGIHVVTKLVQGIEFASLIDIGCGDGKFLYELSKVSDNKRFVGIDYSPRAVSFAKGFSPHIDFKCFDLTNNDLGEQFDVATLIEVLEHISPENISRFLSGVKKTLKPGGRLIMTVPHSNVPVSPKHFRHFSSAQLRDLLQPFFQKIEIVPFDKSTFFLKFLNSICNRTRIIINSQKILNLRWQYYLKNCLFDVQEKDCRRLAAVCT